MSTRRYLPIIALVLLLLPSAALAQQFNLDLGESGPLTGRLIQLIVLVTVLALAPSILIVLTSFTRIVIVLSLLRSAMGVQQTPPNVVLISLALFLTAFVMAPTLERVYDNGVAPLINQEIEEREAFDRSIEPIHEFMRRHVSDTDLATFMDMANIEQPATAEDIPLRALIPASLLQRDQAHQRTQARLRNWLFAVHPISNHRHGGRVGFDVDGHDDVATDYYFIAVQTDLFCSGRRLEAGLGEPRPKLRLTCSY